MTCNNFDGTCVNFITLNVVVKIHDLSKPGARYIRAKWAAAGKKGLEISGTLTPKSGEDLSSKGLNSIIESSSNGRRHNGDKIVQVIAEALKKKEKENIDMDEEERRVKSPGRRTSTTVANVPKRRQSKI